VIAPALAAIADAPQPVVAAIEGNCVGGGLEIASVCDLRIAADGCRLGAPVGKLGFPLALPELAPLLRLVGPGVAAELLIAGRLLDAQEACAKGLVQRVVPADGLAAAVDETVQAVLAGSPLAARLNKQNLRMLSAQGGSYTDAQLEASFAFFASADYSEGMQAFLARRPARFSGR
jgi:enoyl-CoA hydratase